MADATIDRINPTDLDTIVHLYNSMFRPNRDIEWLTRRIIGRLKPLVQVARIKNDAVGFYAGWEHKPDTHFAWIVGVVPEMRRAGIGTQMLRAAGEWARTEGYDYMRFEASNRVRPFLHFGISEGYDIIGVRWEHEQMANVVVMEKPLNAVIDD